MHFATGNTDNRRAASELIFDLDVLGGHDFEEAMVTVFQRLGFETERGKLANDEGRDIILAAANQRIIVECKHQKSSVGRPVVQKLHSAVITFPNAYKGLVVATSSFSPAAKKYLHEANTGSVQIELWDYERLLQEARAVGVYFVRSSQALYFQVPGRTPGRFDSALRENHIERIRSHPRTAREVICLKSSTLELVPALLIAYSVDVKFETQAGRLYRALEDDRQIYGLAGHQLLSKEQEYWRYRTPELTQASTVNGKPLAQYFGEPTRALVEKIKNTVARRLTKTISYSGRNHQAYRKLCEVRPGDVKVQVKQVLYPRWSVDIDVGQKKYKVSLADDAATAPQVVHTSGFTQGDEGFVQGNGILCNDCALIVPANGVHRGLTCDSCQRTLCLPHSWKCPRPFLWQSARLCAHCYKSQDNSALEAPDVLSNYWYAVLLGCVPGLSFAIAKKYLVAVLFVFTAVFVGVATKLEWLLVVVVLSNLLTLCATARIRLHRKNLTVLATYAPEWRHDPQV